MKLLRDLQNSYYTKSKGGCARMDKTLSTKKDEALSSSILNNKCSKIKGLQLLSSKLDGTLDYLKDKLANKKDIHGSPVVTPPLDMNLDLFSYLNVNKSNKNVIDCDWDRVMNPFYKMSGNLESSIIDLNEKKGREDHFRKVREMFSFAKTYIFMTGSFSPQAYPNEEVCDMINKFLSQDGNTLILMAGPTYKPQKCEDTSDDKSCNKQNYFFFQSNIRIPLHYHLAIGEKKSRMYFHLSHDETIPLRYAYQIDNSDLISHIALSSFKHLIEEKVTTRRTTRISKGDCSHNVADWLQNLNIHYKPGMCINKVSHGDIK
jgi:hypothetical protein